MAAFGWLLDGNTGGLVEQGTGDGEGDGTTIFCSDGAGGAFCPLETFGGVVRLDCGAGGAGVVLLVARRGTSTDVGPEGCIHVHVKYR